MNAISIPKPKFSSSLEQKQDHSRHIPALDGIRGFAVLLVTIYRFNGTSELTEASSSILAKIFAAGYRGVDLFFVLSGFLITGILLEAKKEPHYFLNFYARRSLRIFPLYFGTLLLTLTMLPLLSTGAAAIFDEPRAHQVWLWLYGSNVLQAWTGKWMFGCLNHFWSLAVEEHFYFIWPMIIYLTSRRGAIVACLVTIGVATIGRVTWILCGGNDVAPEVFTPFRADALAIGGLIALLSKSPEGSARLVAVARISTWLLAGVLCVVTLSERRFLAIPDSLFALFFAGLLICGVAAPKNSLTSAVWSSRFLRFFGKYSYAIYIFQYPLIPLLAPVISISVLATRLGNHDVARIFYIVLMTTITTGLAIFSWYAIEKRFLTLKCYFEPSRKSRVQSA